MAKIIIISNYYPPVKSVATNRIISFAKYLKEFGHQITVLTVGEYASDQLEYGVRVIRVCNNSTFRMFDTNKKENKFQHYLKCAYNLLLMQMVEDENVGWTKNTIASLDYIIKKEFDIVISSYPSMSTMLVANALKERKPEIKWIADMRDAVWSPRIIWLKRKKLMANFQKMAKEIDGLLAVSRPQLELYTHLMENTGAIIAEVRNGYDFEIGKMLHNKPDSEFFTIVYAGSFYGSIKPDKFFKALNNIEEQYRLKIKVRIIGNKAPIKIPISLTKLVIQEQTMSYCSLIDEIKSNAVAVLMILPKGLESGIYTGKLFDYLGCCKPIIGLVPADDVAAKLIRKARAGYIAENEDIEGMKKIILQAYNDWKNEVEFRPDVRIIKQHHRREQARRLHEVVCTLLKTRKRI